MVPAGGPLRTAPISPLSASAVALRRVPRWHLNRHRHHGNMANIHANTSNDIGLC